MRLNLNLVALLFLGASAVTASAAEPADALVGVWASRCGDAIGEGNQLTVYTLGSAPGTLWVTSIASGKDGIKASTYPANIKANPLNGRVDLEYVHDAARVNRATLNMTQPKSYFFEKVINENGVVTTDNGVSLSSGKKRPPFQQCSSALPTAKSH